MPTLEDEVGRAIRSVNDYPRKGFIGFRDLTTLWKDGQLTRRTTDALVEYSRTRRPDKVLGIESRGFIVAAPIADRLGIGLVPARKIGKLPREKLTADYQLEYGKDGIEVHQDAISSGERVLIVDDLLATGGTSDAARRLVEQAGGKVAGFVFVVELTYLKGKEKLAGYDVFSLVKYDKE